MSLVSELKRRNVVRVGVAYLALAWLLTEVAGTVFPLFGVPEWSVRFIVILFALGFIPALVLSWVYEITPEGIKREKDVVRSDSITRLTARRLDLFTIGVVAVALVFILVDRLWIGPRRDVVTLPDKAVAQPEQAVDTPETSYPPNSIAVLPFVNMSDDPANEYFSDGISDEMLNLLTRIPELRVVARTSSFAFKGQDKEIREIAGSLKVAHVLEGSVRKSGNRVRITAQLINTSDGYHLWSASYDRTLNDIFAVQDEIAAAVVEQLKISLLGGAPLVEATDPEAYELYLRGNDYFYRGLGDPSIVIAADLYEQALQIDPDFVLAKVGLAKTHARIFFQGLDSSLAARDRARESMNEAVRSAPNLPAVRAARGWYFYWVERESGKALEQFKLALAEQPNDSELLLGLGLSERRVARWEPALKHLNQSFELDPLSNEKAIELGISYSFRGDYQKAADCFRRAIGLAPDQYRSRAHLAETLVAGQGSLEGALATLNEGGEVVGPREFIVRMLSPQPPWDAQMKLPLVFPETFSSLDPGSMTGTQALEFLLIRAYQHHREGRFEAAREDARLVLGLAEQMSDAENLQIGLAYALLGQRDAAERYLDVPLQSSEINARNYQENVMLGAYGQLLLGNRAAAIERLDHALSVPGGSSISTLLVSPHWHSLHDAPEFQQLLAK